MRSKEWLVMKKSNFWLVIYNKSIERVYTKYFESNKEKSKYLDKIKYLDSIIIIEDSSDIIYT